MINPAAVPNDVYDYLDGNVSDFYNAVDDAIVKSECVKGQYRISTSPAPPVPPATATGGGSGQISAARSK